MEENKRLKTALEERKLVEKAKGIVMEAKGLSEQEAYKYMQKLSMDKCVPIARVARSINEPPEKKIKFLKIFFY